LSKGKQNFYFFFFSFALGLNDFSNILSTAGALGGKKLIIYCFNNFFSVVFSPSCDAGFFLEKDVCLGKS